MTRVAPVRTRTGRGSGGGGEGMDSLFARAFAIGLQAKLFARTLLDPDEPYQPLRWK